MIPDASLTYEQLQLVRVHEARFEVGAPTTTVSDLLPGMLFRFDWSCDDTLYRKLENGYCVEKHYRMLLSFSQPDWELITIPDLVAMDCAVVLVPEESFREIISD